MSVKSLASVDARIRELKAELKASTVYQELAVLEEMRPKLAAINGVATDMSTVSDVPKRKGKQPKGRVAQHEAASLAVKAAAHPLQIGEIVEAMPAHGAQPSKKNAETNLTSILSKRGDLVSIRWHEKRCWWFKDQEVPQ